jgi:hypothetical protein
MQLGDGVVVGKFEKTSAFTVEIADHIILKDCATGEKLGFGLDRINLFLISHFVEDQT